MDDDVLRIIQHDQEYFTLSARSLPDLYDGYKPFSIWGVSALVAFSVFSLRSLTPEQSKGMRARSIQVDKKGKNIQHGGKNGNFKKENMKWTRKKWQYTR